jgi:hypothetical protein
MLTSLEASSVVGLASFVYLRLKEEQQLLNPQKALITDQP